jgi:pyridoxamine 5'-phosphate oxidase
MKNIYDSRKEYKKLQLEEEVILSNPIDQFNLWFHELENTKNNNFEINAMTVSTVGVCGEPTNRVVLLKEYSKNGFIFFTNYTSKKGRDLAINNHICASFFWWPLERQVIIKGKAVKIDNKESEEYFKSRPKGSQIGAIISNQSQVINGREELDKKYEFLMEKHKESSLNKPENWGGYRIDPIEIEFWQGRESRLHDRIRYLLQPTLDWKIERLSP